MIRRLALVLPLAGLLLVAGTLVVFACQPDPRIPKRRVVIVPAAAPKSLVVWWDYDLTYSDSIPYSDGKAAAPFFPVAWYAGSESAANLIAERQPAGERLRWGPMASETEYEVAWRGAGEVHIQVPQDATESQIEAWKAEIRRCEGHSTMSISIVPLQD